MAIELKVRVKEGDKPTPTRAFSKRQETAVAKAVGGQRTPNSGATPWVKGDVLTSGAESWLIECKTKTTHADSIKINREWFEKNAQEAVFQGKKHTALVFSFGPDEPNHYVIDEYLFRELLERLNEKDPD